MFFSDGKEEKNIESQLSVQFWKPEINGEMVKKKMFTISDINKKEVCLKRPVKVQIELH